MLPFLHIGPLSISTFGLSLWVAAAVAAWVLDRNFRRHGVRADAFGVVAIATLAGIAGAKLWHVFETPRELFAHPLAMLFDNGGFAWYGGLLAGILALGIEGARSRRQDGRRLGAVAMLDLATPAAAIGYGIGRIGCLTSGDGDYGVPTSLPWGMSFPHGLVPTTERVHPTPIYELLMAAVIAWVLWRRSARPRPPGQLTGEYLVLAGAARFLVEFIRINPRLYWGMSNAQVASLASMAAGALLIGRALARRPAQVLEPAETAK